MALDHFSNDSTLKFAWVWLLLQMSISFLICKTIDPLEVKPYLNFLNLTAFYLITYS